MEIRPNIQIYNKNDLLFFIYDVKTDHKLPIAVCTFQESIENFSKLLIENIKV